MHFINSWGPPDDGQTIEGPRTLTQAALEQGVRSGRSGLGSIFVLASGNGGSSDYCTFDGYASSIYTIAVGAVDIQGKLPPYGELCPSQLISAFSGGSGPNNRVVSTRDLISNFKCVHHLLRMFHRLPRIYRVRIAHSHLVAPKIILELQQLRLLSQE